MMSIWCADGSNVVDDDGNKECDNNHYFVADMHKVTVIIYQVDFLQTLA